ncbi:WxL domain-containing protein [Lactiplantibacillus herbarum]|uniref:WxL domain-containing protein n=1 Tax=Lactiplantibacillus herbarum TaxID=1670446 RepID=UPI00064EA326|nr:WxL domain-containing protein [Lactiplantibacillus herbarum]
MFAKLSICAGVIALAMGAAGITASAATTAGSVTFQDDTTATAPVDPTNPVNPQTPADPNNPATGNTGTLTLDVAPAAIAFGTVTTSNAAKTYQATGTYNQYLQISDKRTTANGWQVNVKQDHALTDTSSGYVLTGAVIHLPQGTARNSLNTPATVADPNITVTTGGVGVTTSDQVVVAAPNQAGVGKAVSTDTWVANAVTLTVPKLTAKVGNYTNTLTWTLTAAVGS